MHLLRGGGVDLDAGEVGDAVDVVEGQGHGGLDVRSDPVTGSNRPDRRLLRGSSAARRGRYGKGPKLAQNGKKPRQISAEDKVMMLSYSVFF